MFTFGLTGGVHGFDPLILLLMALILEAYVGEAAVLFRFVPHPVIVIGRAIDFFERKLNRPQRSPADRAVRGALVVLIMVICAGAIGWAVSWLGLNHDFGWILETFLVLFLLAQRSLYDHVRRVALGLRQGGLEGGRLAVAHIVGRDTTQLDEHGVARAAIESCAENFNDGVVAPVFWFVLFGMPGLLIYKTVNTMDSMIGHRTERLRAFGMTAARLDDVLNLIPARLSGLFIVIAAAFAPQGRPLKALGIMWRDAGKHCSPNAGWPEAAMAGALGLALGGPRKYAEGQLNEPWIGDGRARAEIGDIRRALYVYFVACLINAMWVAALAVVRYGV